MGLHDTVSAERLHIGFFGIRNAGKSSLVNVITGQQMSVVSDIKGTTTDPVKKAMELLPLGPVVIIDTPGIDDEGILGDMRVQKTRQILAKTDIAVLVVNAECGLSDMDKDLIKLFEDKKLPYIIAYNKCDLLSEKPTPNENEIYVSAATKENIIELKEKIGAFSKKFAAPKYILRDLINTGDTIILVIPVDASAPKGRLILPQQQTMREILDAHCSVVACQDTELSKTLSSLSVKPKLIITDSQAFGRVSKDTPEDILLTSFSILFARYKGDLRQLILGAAQISRLKNKDRVLISEGCTHHRQCNDIGTVKMPNWINTFTGASLEFTFTSGGEFPEDLSPYSLIIHCGGCMLNEKEMKHRIASAEASGVPIVNYGIAIAHMHGILARSLKPFPDMLELLQN